MPQDGSNNYYYPPGTRGIPDQTIESEAYNTFLDDLITRDLNIPRPIHRGGTDATTAAQALINLGGEEANQQVTNYDSHVFISGSFWSDSTATGGPVVSETFVGIAYRYDNADNDVVIEARSITSDPTPGKLYVRRKKTNVWGAWLEQVGNVADADTRYVNIAGDTMTGDLAISKATPGVGLNKLASGQYAYVIGSINSVRRWGVYLGDAVAEGGSNAGSNFSIESYNDAGAFLDTALAINRATGLASVKGDPTAQLGVATKQYVDSSKSVPAGSTMLFAQSATPVGWTKVTDAGKHNIGIRIATQGAEGGGVGGSVGFTSLFSRTVTDDCTLLNAAIPRHYHVFTSGHRLVVANSGGTVGGNGGDWVSGYGDPDSGYQATGDGAHVHGIDMRLRYIDIIMAVKS